MIYTRFGSPVKVLGGDVGRGIVKFERDDGKIFDRVWIGEMKADGGIDEIVRAIEDAAE